MQQCREMSLKTRAFLEIKPEYRRKRRSLRFERASTSFPQLKDQAQSMYPHPWLGRHHARPVALQHPTSPADDDRGSDPTALIRSPARTLMVRL
jgi:hypothetical protein